MVPLGSDLTARIAQLPRPITIMITAPNPSLRRQLTELLEDVSGNAYQKTIIPVHVPGSELTVRLVESDRLWSMAFWGLPTGFMLDALVEAMEALSGRVPPPDWPEPICQVLTGLPRLVQIRLFVGATCKFCHPMVHRAIQVVALGTPVHFDVIPVDQFPLNAQAARVSSTPTLLDRATGRILAANVPAAHLAGWLYQTAFEGLSAGPS